MNLHDVHRGIKKHKRRKRLGRGPGSGHGKTSGRGHKGLYSRSGSSMRSTYEGGQMPISRRIAKRGFNNKWAKTIRVVNIGDLERVFSVGAVIDPEALRLAGLANGCFDGVKILGDGELTKKMTVKAHRFSKTAVEKIRQAGGEVVVLSSEGGSN
jgi:large subunit ribosomal protein L15